MSFWNGLKSAFGFSSTEEEDYEEYDSSVPTYAVERHENETDASLHVKDEKSAPAPGDLPGDIFDAVIELFNSTMPEFVSSSLNTEAQRKYIYDHISASLRARIEAAVSGEAAALESAGLDDDEERRQLIDTLSDAKDEASSLREEMRKLRSSADRQKRALTDRITDLDRRLNEVKAEKERILTSRKPQRGDDSAKIAQQDETIARLNEQITSLNSRIEQLDADVEKERTLKEQLELKATMTDTMINDLRAQASQAKEELSKAEAELAIAAEIQDKLERFEQIKERKDAKINELSEKIKQLTSALESAPAAPTADSDEIARLRDENASLSHTIETNLYNQANAEMKLRNEIKQLRAELDDTLAKLQAAQSAPALIETTPAAQPPRRRRGRPRKSREALDGNIDSTDWLDESESTGKFAPDFGYHEPPRTIVPENDAQLSLF